MSQKGEVKAEFIDDFDDFQSAPAATTSAPVAAKSANSNLFDLLNSSSTSKPAGQSAPGYGANTSFISAPAAPSGIGMPSLAPQPVSRPSYTSPAASTTSAVSPKPAASSSKSTFDDLFNTSLTSMGGQTNNGQKPGQKSMKDLEKEKSANALWAPSGSSNASAPPRSNGGGFDDLLM